MIERLRTSLEALHLLGPGDLVSPEQERLRADCADALRLELDCPQQSLTRPQREHLARLDGLLEEPHPDPARLAAAVQAAWSVIQ